MVSWLLSWDQSLDELDTFFFVTYTFTKVMSTGIPDHARIFCLLEVLVCRVVTFAGPPRDWKSEVV